MQRQAVPLLRTEAPAGRYRGIEGKAAVDSGVALSQNMPALLSAPPPTRSSSREMTTAQRMLYHLIKFHEATSPTATTRSRSFTRTTMLRQARLSRTVRPPKNGEIALGKNPLIGFMTWEGYNYEDAVLLSERLVMEDVYTSVHIEESMEASP